MRYKYRRLVLNVVLYEKKLGPILPLCQLLWCVMERRGEEEVRDKKLRQWGHPHREEVE